MKATARTGALFELVPTSRPRDIARVLAIPHGATKDAEGYAWGDNWPLADCGQSDTKIAYRVTGHGVRSSEYDCLPNAQETAQILADAINRGDHLRLQDGGPTAETTIAAIGKALEAHRDGAWDDAAVLRLIAGLVAR